MKAPSLLVIYSLCISGFGADQCGLTTANVALVTGYFRYQNGLGRNHQYLKHLTAARIGEATALRDDDLFPYQNPEVSEVFVLSKAHKLDLITCPADAGWLSCAGDWARVSPTEPALSPVEASREPTCNLTLPISAWRSSPDNEQKRRIASELLKELLGFGYADPEAIYARDFNLEDPEIDFYIVDSEGMPEFQGCHFSLVESPHCGWHLYGQTRLDALKREIMSHP